MSKKFNKEKEVKMIIGWDSAIVMSTPEPGETEVTESTTTQMKLFTEEEIQRRKSIYEYLNQIIEPMANDILEDLEETATIGKKPFKSYMKGRRRLNTLYLIENTINTIMGTNDIKDLQMLDNIGYINKELEVCCTIGDIKKYETLLAQLPELQNYFTEDILLNFQLPAAFEITGGKHLEDRPPSEILTDETFPIMDTAVRWTINSICASKNEIAEVITRIKGLHKCLNDLEKTAFNRQGLELRTE